MLEQIQQRLKWSPSSRCGRAAVGLFWLLVGLTQRTLPADPCPPKDVHLEKSLKEKANNNNNKPLVIKQTALATSRVGDRFFQVMDRRLGQCLSVDTERTLGPVHGLQVLFFDWILPSVNQGL